MDKIVNLKNIAGIESFSSRFARLGDLYILSHIDVQERIKESQGKLSASDVIPGMNLPLRLNGMLFVLIQRGEIELNVNTVEYKISVDDILVIRPGTLMTFLNISEKCKFTILFTSSTFLNSINIDLNSIEFTSILSNPQPAMELTESESKVLRKYFDLLDVNTADKTESVFATRIARTLIAAMVYEILRFALTRAVVHSNEDGTDKDEKQGRAYNYVFRFMQLLHTNYSRERNLEFYAQQLCITPKYLSMVTREVTGFSASEWINRVVILEAKNMLRFSGKNIQEIAYSLNFPSQSAFGKYFKRITGQSPSEYLKT